MLYMEFAQHNMENWRKQKKKKIGSDKWIESKILEIKNQRWWESYRVGFE